jgi:hypothetical protein
MTGDAYRFRVVESSEVGNERGVGIVAFLASGYLEVPVIIR